MKIDSTYNQQAGVIQQHKKLDANSRVKLQKALKDFEAIFVNYMLKSMKATVPKSEMESDSFGSEMFEGMFNLEVARQISHNSNLGLGDKMFKQITGETSKSISAEKLSPVPNSKRETRINKLEVETPNSHEEQKSNSVIDQRIKSLESFINKAAEYHGVDSSLVKAVIAAESGGDIKAQSSKQAKGIMQLIDSTANDMGVRNIWDPQENIFGGTKYLKQMIERFGGNIKEAVASYNAGPGAVEKHGGIPPYKETQDYVNKVLNYIQYFQQQEDLHDETN